MVIIYRVVFIHAPTLTAALLAMRKDWGAATFLLLAAHIASEMLHHDETRAMLDRITRLAEEANEGILDRMRQMLDRK